jgi:hypothetical protein
VLHFDSGCEPISAGKPQPDRQARGIVFHVDLRAVPPRNGGDEAEPMATPKGSVGRLMD